MSRPESADDPSRRDPERTLASDPARPAGLPAPLAPLPAAPAASAIWTSLPPPAIWALNLPSAHRGGQKTLATAALACDSPPPPRVHTPLLTTKRSTGCAQAAQPTPPWLRARPCPPAHRVRQSATTPPRRGQGRDSLASRRLGHGRRGTQWSTKCASEGHRNLPNWATQPGRLMALRARRPRPPGIYTMGRAQRPAHLPLAVPSAAHKPGPPPVGADLVHARPLPPRGCPEAAHSRPLAPGTHRPFWAARDRSGRGLHRPASREIVRGLPDPLCRRRPRRNEHTPLRASLRDAPIGCHSWRSWWRISRSAPTRRDGSNLITGVCSISP